MNAIKKVSNKSGEHNMRSIAVVLFIAGLLLMPAHYLLLQKHQVHSDENWLISLDFRPAVKQADTYISIQPPYETANIRLMGRNINHAGLRIAAPVRNGFSKRGIRLRATAAGAYQVGVEFRLQLSQTPHFHDPVANLLTTKNRQLFLSDDEWLQLEDPVLEAKLIDLGLNDVEQEQLAEKIFQFVYKLANHDPSALRKVPDMLRSRSANYQERSLLMVALCRKAGLPARVVSGLELMDDPAATPLNWVEVYVNDRWLSYHPGLGYAQTLPVHYLALDKSGDGIVSSFIKEADSMLKQPALDYDIMIERIPETIASPNNARRDWYQVFMLERLSAETRQQLALLMLLPLGALLCSVVRQLAGVHSYGVFTPTMLALAITYADKETTLLILMISLTLVYLGRPTFHRQMSRTPRLSIIFTLVAMSIVLGVSLLDYVSLSTDGHLILLPMVIITSLVDRLFSTIEINGYHTAFIRLVWTLILTLITLPVLQMEWLGAWILRYPEFHLFTLSMLIMVSLYPFGKHKFPAWLSLLAEPKKQTVSTREKVQDEG